MASVLKTDIGKPIVGSNPTSSALSKTLSMTLSMTLSKTLSMTLSRLKNGDRRRHVANPTSARVAIGNPLLHTCITSALRQRRERWECL